MNAKEHSGFTHILFYLGLALLTCHELDAVARHEWRLLPVLNQLDDSLGQITFILFHIPLFVIIFWISGHKNENIRIRSQMTLDIFLILHGLVHFLLSDHQLYEFEAPVETITVYGGAFVGLLHLGLILRRFYRSSSIRD